MTKRRMEEHRGVSNARGKNIRRTSMTRLRLLATATILLALPVSMSSQQSTPMPVHADQQERAHGSLSSVDQHLKLLSEKLGLTADQQNEIRPILKQMMGARQKLIENTSLSDEARHQKEKTLHEKADKEARRFLNDDQKKKLDELEQQHP
jgi:hypothetical protein